MPELYAVLLTVAQVAGYALVALLLIAICMPILAGLVLAGAYSVMVYKSAVSWVTDDDEGEEI